jgi:hypothetical protein
MHFHLPKPLHGWREFVGEVGIIVLGVLIALAAEQVVEWLNWQVKVAATERAISRDLALAADVASERVAIKRCLDERLDLLRQKFKHTDPEVALPLNSGGYPMLHAYRAPSRAWNSDLWNGILADGTVQHLDPERARALNLLYLTVRSAHDANTEEKIAATDLWILGNKDVELTSDKQVELLQLIDRLSRINDELYGLSRQILRRISDLGYLPPLDTTERRLAGPYSLAMQCKYAQRDLRDRVSTGWFTLHR